MESLNTYLLEAVTGPTGISAFDWGETLHCTTIDTLGQQLPGYGFKPTKSHVKQGEYKVTHNGACITIGVRPKAEGEGNRIPNVKMFVRLCNCGRISVVTKYLNIEGDGKATYKTLSLDGPEFVWTPCKGTELPTCGNIDDSAEFAQQLLKHILRRSKRYTK